MSDGKLVLEMVARGILIGDTTTGYKINPYLEMPKSLSFSDVAIGQGKNVCLSRSDAVISSEIARGLYLKVPLIAANMSSVTNAETCISLYNNGALGVLHRAWLHDSDYIREVGRISDKCSIVAAAVGVGPGQVELAKKLVTAGATVIVIDIAQGYSDSVIEVGRQIKKETGVCLIVGNTINTQMMYEVDSFADAVKVGIAQGSACTTKNTAGCSEKQFSVVAKFKDISVTLGLPIISDGGTSEPADFTKSIAAGANSVMAGKIFARCPESAADVVEIDGETKKLYFGMASKEAQRRWRGGLKEGTCAEGKTLLLDIGEDIPSLLEKYAGALRSGITYAGATNIKSLQDLVKFIRV